MKKPIAWPPSVLSAVPDPCTEVTLRILTLPTLLVSRWPSATTITSTLGKSATLTGLSGFATKGLVRITSPEGAVRRKIDQEKYSSVTGFCCASAAADHAAMTLPRTAPSRRRDIGFLT